MHDYSDILVVDQRWKWVIFRDPWPMAITSFHPTHGTRGSV